MADDKVITINADGSATCDACKITYPDLRTLASAVCKSTGLHIDSAPLPERCRDCDAAAKHANSDATTPGFFYDKCAKHRTSPPQQEGAEERYRRALREIRQIAIHVGRPDTYEVFHAIVAIAERALAERPE